MGHIFGYSFEQIQRAQQGGCLGTTIDVSRPPQSDANLSADQLLLDTHGLEGLKSLGYMGVIDRLVHAGVLSQTISALSFTDRQFIIVKDETNFTERNNELMPKDDVVGDMADCPAMSD